MGLVTLLQHRGVYSLSAATFGLVLAACGQADDAPPLGDEAMLAECGGSLDELLGRATNAEPRIAATYSDALAEWAFEDEFCGLGVFTGRCADGKRLLYRNGGFTSEIRYFDGERLVGYVGSGDVLICPSLCPSSRFYGDVESVRCDSPVLEELCPGSSRFLDGDRLWMPFANGEAPGGCN